MKKVIKYAVVGFACGVAVATVRVSLLPLATVVSLLEAPILPLLGAGGGVYIAIKEKGDK